MNTPHSQIDVIPDSKERCALTGSIRSGWRLVVSLFIEIERDDDGTFIVSDDEFAVHGDGETREQAIRDYVDSLIEYYELLRSHSQENAQTLELFNRLQTYLQKIAD